MPIIRRKFNYRKVMLGQHGVVGSDSSLSGRTVDVFMGSETEPINFDGFVDWDEFSGRGAVLTNIEAYTPSDSQMGEWVEFNYSDWLLGQMNNHGVSLVLHNNEPVKVGSRKEKRSVIENNIRSIGRRG